MEFSRFRIDDFFVILIIEKFPNFWFFELYSIFFNILHRISHIFFFFNSISIWRLFSKWDILIAYIFLLIFDLIDFSLLFGLFYHLCCPIIFVCFSFPSKSHIVQKSQFFTIVWFFFFYLENRIFKSKNWFEPWTYFNFSAEKHFKKEKKNKIFLSIFCWRENSNSFFLFWRKNSNSQGKIWKKKKKKKKKTTLKRQNEFLDKNWVFSSIITMKRKWFLKWK